MEIRIGAGGQLYIMRAGTLKMQGCPYDDNGHYCGDYCPLFGEPDMEPPQSLEICSIVLCGTITDERVSS